MAVSRGDAGSRVDLQMAPETGTDESREASRRAKHSQSQNTKAEVVTAALIFLGSVWLIGWALYQTLAHFFP